MNFTIESFFNSHLASGATRLDSVLTVSASNSGGVVATPRTGKNAVLFVIDVSGSMAEKHKLEMAKVALRRCISLLDDSTYFSVIAFSSSPSAIVPLSLATSSNLEAAHDRIKMLVAEGGTCMSRALECARQELVKQPDAIAFVQFLTDGENDRNDKSYLDDVLGHCEGKFQCDCWGVGTDWQPDDLRKISGRLLGSADAVPNADQLETSFKGALANALSKGVGDVRLRLQLPRTSKLTSVKQMSPEIADLSKLIKQVDDKNIDVPLGAWGEESRDYHVAFVIEPQVDGEEMMACRPKVVFVDNGSETIVDGQRIIATWTSDESLSTRINSQVAHYTGQEELASSIKEGLEAKARGDIDQATVLLGKAAKIAHDSGNEEVTQRLKKVVDVVDIDQGTVRLKSGSNKAADLELDMGMGRTVRISKKSN